MSQPISDSGDARKSEFQKIVDGFLLPSGLPFSDVLSSQRIKRVFRRHGGVFGENRIFNLVVIIDLYSRKVVGWSMSEEMTTDVFLSALQMALGRRGDVSGLVHHSDRGSQYCSHAFQNALHREGIACSKVAKGTAGTTQLQRVSLRP